MPYQFFTNYPAPQFTTPVDQSAKMLQTVGAINQMANNYQQQQMNAMQMKEAYRKQAKAAQKEKLDKQTMEAIKALGPGASPFDQAMVVRNVYSQAGTDPEVMMEMNNKLQSFVGEALKNRDTKTAAQVTAAIKGVPYDENFQRDFDQRWTNYEVSANPEGYAITAQIPGQAPTVTSGMTKLGEQKTAQAQEKEAYQRAKDERNFAADQAYRAQQMRASQAQLGMQARRLRMEEQQMADISEQRRAQTELTFAKTEEMKMLSDAKLQNMLAKTGAINAAVAQKDQQLDINRAKLVETQMDRLSRETIADKNRVSQEIRADAKNLVTLYGIDSTNNRAAQKLLQTADEFAKKMEVAKDEQTFKEHHRQFVRLMMEADQALKEQKFAQDTKNKKSELEQSRAMWAAKLEQARTNPAARAKGQTELDKINYQIRVLDLQERIRRSQRDLSALTPAQQEKVMFQNAKSTANALDRLGKIEKEEAQALMDIETLNVAPASEVMAKNTDNELGQVLAKLLAGKDKRRLMTPEEQRVLSAHVQMAYRIRKQALAASALNTASVSGDQNLFELASQMFEQNAPDMSERTMGGSAGSQTGGTPGNKFGPAAQKGAALRDRGLIPPSTPPQAQWLPSAVSPNIRGDMP